MKSQPYSVEKKKETELIQGLIYSKLSLGIQGAMCDVLSTHPLSLSHTSPVLVSIRLCSWGYVSLSCYTDFFFAVTC